MKRSKAHQHVQEVTEHTVSWRNINRKQHICTRAKSAIGAVGVHFSLKFVQIHSCYSKSHVIHVSNPTKPLAISEMAKREKYTYHGNATVENEKLEELERKTNRKKYKPHL
jgi:hypothetical protein